jgi:superfamily II DNA or RNA helicase
VIDAPWPEPIASTSDEAATAIVRQLWSKADRIDAAVADVNRLHLLVGKQATDDDSRSVRVVTRTYPITSSGACWQYTVVRQAHGSEFLLFYPSGSTFPDGALVFTGSLDGHGWVTFHRRPFVLYRLHERFNSLVIQQPAAVAAVREQSAVNNPIRTATPAVPSKELGLVSPASVYRSVLSAHFSDHEARSGEDPRPEFAPILAAHQERAYERARDILDRYGGVIIADAVGLGKTFIGLRLLEHATQSGGRVVVIVPAALRHQWERELLYLTSPPVSNPLPESKNIGQADTLDLWVRELGRVTLLSMESLGRSGFDPSPYRGAGLVMVDEAHNFRNPSTQRYRNLADLSRHSRVVLLTATPINNSVLDLQHLLDLYAAPGAFRHLGIPDYRNTFQRAAADGSAIHSIISACVLRRTRNFLKKRYGEIRLRDPRSDREIELRFPKRLPPIAIDYDLAGTYGQLFDGLEEWLDKLRFPFFSSNDGDEHTDHRVTDSGVLLKMILLKRLESSIEAFRRTVIQQLAWCNTALSAMKAGRVLSRPDYRALFKGPEDDPGSQLAFFELMLPSPTMEVSQIDELRVALQGDVQILARIHAALASVGLLGDRKLQRLAELLDGPLADAKVLVFTEFRDTARYIYHALKTRPFIARIDSDSARLGLDRASRRDVIGRFAPRSNDLPEPPTRERVDILIATDVLSEGLNLQDASAVVSYDLPWNPVRLMQRIGRIDRLGAVNDVVTLHHFVPADSLERLLGLMSRLQEKVSTIDASLGIDQPVLAIPNNSDITIQQIRTLAQGPAGLERVENEIEGPLDPEEQAYLDFVELVRCDVETTPTGVAAGVVTDDAFSGRRAVAYWTLTSGDQRRGLWLVCDLDTGCVTEDQNTVLATLRRARTLASTSEEDNGNLRAARTLCDRYATSVKARLEATRIAGDALNPHLPQCRIAAWLSQALRQPHRRLGAGARSTIDDLLSRLARRYTVAAERTIAQLADRLPEAVDPTTIEEIDRLLSACPSGSDRPTQLREIAILLVVGTGP